MQYQGAQDTPPSVPAPAVHGAAVDVRKTAPWATPSGEPESPQDLLDRVGFAHRFFHAFPDLYFRLSESGSEPVAAFRIGKTDALLSFRGLKAEFKLADDGPDGRMLALIGEALNFVSALRVGDPVPGEVLTGAASWEPSEEYRRLAYCRVAVQLATWLDGREQLITDHERLSRLAGDPITKRKMTLACEEAAGRLGLGRTRYHEVAENIELLGAELSYIESLRASIRTVVEIEEKIQGLRRLYGRERSILDIVDPVARLIDRASREFTRRFEELDAHTAEIMAVLRNTKGHVEFLRGNRNDLYRRLRAWHSTFSAWKGARVERSTKNEDMLRAAYRFLAPRFMHIKEWELVTKAGGLPVAGTSARAGHTVEVRPERPFKYFVRW